MKKIASEFFIISYFSMVRTCLDWSADGISFLVL